MLSSIIGFSALILLYYLCIGSNESVSLGGSHEAPKSYINDCSTEIDSGTKLRDVSLFTSADNSSVCLSANYFTMDKHAKPYLLCLPF